MADEHIGRPTKLTPEVHESIVSAVRKGVPLEPACEASGIDPSSYQAWLRWGKQGQGKEPYASFSVAVTRARAEAEIELVETAKAGDEAGTSNGPAKCAQWLLERTRGNRYAARVNVKVEEELEGLLDVLERVCSKKDCSCHSEILEALAARARGEALGTAESEESASVH